MARTIQLFAGIQFLIIGLSHLLQPRAWVAFFITLRGLGTTGVFANAFLSLWFGSIIVVFHDVWSTWAVVLTVIGWLQVVKGAIGFILPQVSMRSFERVSYERAFEFQIAGVIALILAALMGYLLVST